MSTPACSQCQQAMVYAQRILNRWLCHACVTMFAMEWMKQEAEASADRAAAFEPPRQPDKVVHLEPEPNRQRIEHSGAPDFANAPSAIPPEPARQRIAYEADKPPVVSVAPPVAQPRPLAPQRPRGGYTGEFCPNCYSDRMIRAGTCSVCQNCGETSECA